jgi:hypothetical protein
MMKKRAEYWCTLCGMTFRSYGAEARHRHNAPLLCKTNKKKLPKENKDGNVHKDRGSDLS